IYTVSLNLSGMPGISVPCGTHDGLPIGIQFMAPHWEESRILRLAYATQRVRA
ncbi:MAG: Asp-tRNA(Asn)/Glu-tRNA(Gln) amidotransferase subunit GatA, partial [Chitinivibrionales bacterium]|nr:Asp-tRNA(Asn)/Glu-tRNA(Gln) amidotransferase subunit GatA [Chitinivibrionales bacterium]